MKIKLIVLCALSFKLVVAGGGGEFNSLTELTNSIPWIQTLTAEIEANLTAIDKNITDQIAANLATFQDVIMIISNITQLKNFTLQLQELIDALKQAQIEFFTINSLPQFGKDLNYDECMQNFNSLTVLHEKLSTYQQKIDANLAILGRLSNTIVPILQGSLNTLNLTNLVSVEVGKPLVEALLSVNQLATQLQNQNGALSPTANATLLVDKILNSLVQYCPSLKTLKATNLEEKNLNINWNGIIYGFYTDLISVLRYYGQYSTAQPLPYWSQITSAYASSLPCTPVQGGQDSNGAKTYVISAFANNELNVGKLYLSYPPTFNAYVGSFGTEVKAATFSVLCDASYFGKTFKWTAQSNGGLPDFAIWGGFAQPGNYFYVGQSYYNGNLIPGKIYPPTGLIYFPLNGQELSSNNYNALYYQ